MPPCVRHRFSRLPIARIHLSYRSPELISSAFASVRPSARSLHNNDSYTLPTISLPSLPHVPSALFALPTALSSHTRHRRPLSPCRDDPRHRHRHRCHCHRLRRRCRNRFGCIFDRRYDSRGKLVKATRDHHIRRLFFI